MKINNCKKNQSSNTEHFLITSTPNQCLITEPTLTTSMPNQASHSGSFKDISNDNSASEQAAPTKVTTKKRSKKRAREVQETSSQIADETPLPTKFQHDCVSSLLDEVELISGISPPPSPKPDLETVSIV